jgi:hypothetical protein
MFALAWLATLPVFAATPAFHPGVAVYTAYLAEELNGHSTGAKEFAKLRKAADFKAVRSSGLVAAGEQLCAVKDLTRRCWGPELRNGATGIHFDGLSETFSPTSRDKKKFGKELGEFFKRANETRPGAASLWQRLFLETAEAREGEVPYNGSPHFAPYQNEELGQIYASYLGWFAMPLEKYGNAKNEDYEQQLADIITGRTFGHYERHRVQDDEWRSLELTADTRPIKSVSCNGALATLNTTLPGGQPLVVKQSDGGGVRLAAAGHDLAVRAQTADKAEKTCKEIVANGVGLSREWDDDGSTTYRYDPKDPAASKKAAEEIQSNRNRHAGHDGDGEYSYRSIPVSTVNADGTQRVKTGYFSHADYNQFLACAYKAPSQATVVANCTASGCGDTFLAPSEAQLHDWLSLAGITSDEVSAYQSLRAKVEKAVAERDQLRDNPPKGKDGEELTKQLQKADSEVRELSHQLNSTKIGDLCFRTKSADECLALLHSAVGTSMNRLSLRAAAAGKCCADPKCRLHMYKEESGVNFSDEKEEGNTQKAQ